MPATWRRPALAAATAVLLLADAAAQAQPPAPGMSVETAIVLLGVQHENEGVGAEYAYIREHFPGCRPGRQALLGANGRRYDSIQLSGPNCPQAVFFDITDWFGK
ncbi:MAG TPA: hypothetical protein VFA12_08065 [Stellaceae bacterium]|nr:hypothetical protein [Stellaceae bacterium]